MILPHKQLIETENEDFEIDVWKVPEIPIEFKHKRGTNYIKRLKIRKLKDKEVKEQIKEFKK